jgi:hypothetical protein
MDNIIWHTSTQTLSDRFKALYLMYNGNWPMVTAKFDLAAHLQEWVEMEQITDEGCGSEVCRQLVWGEHVQFDPFCISVPSLCTSDGEGDW